MLYEHCSQSGTCRSLGTLFEYQRTRTSIDSDEITDWRSHKFPMGILGCISDFNVFRSSKGPIFSYINVVYDASVLGTTDDL
jgi:hypothetical protein